MACRQQSVAAAPCTPHCQSAWAPPAAQRHAAQLAERRPRRPAARGAAPVGATAGPAASALAEPRQPDLGLAPASDSTRVLDASLVADDADVVGFLRLQYNLSDPRVARGKARRALAALQSADASVAALSLERDVLPKLELLEALSPGLGWRVLKRFPDEFGSPEALERWQLAAAYLHAIGVPPHQITDLFARHCALLKQAVAAPDSLRRLFEWLQRDLGLQPPAMLKVVNRLPALLQLDVDTVLQPRWRFLLDLGLPRERAMTAVLRQPEVLGVASGVLARKAAYLVAEARLSRREVAALLEREPAALMCSLAHLRETVEWLRGELGLEGDVLRRVVAKGGVAKYPLATLQARVAFWRGLGFGAEDVRGMLGRMPRLLLYPAHQPKYQLKLRFLREELRLPLGALAACPSYLSYSLAGRIAPRAAAARALAGRPLPLHLLARKDDAFAAWLGVRPDEWAAFEAAWQTGPDAARWADPPAAAPRGQLPGPAAEHAEAGDA